MHRLHAAVFALAALFSPLFTAPRALAQAAPAPSAAPAAAPAPVFKSYSRATGPLAGRFETVDLQLLILRPEDGVTQGRLDLDRSWRITAKPGDPPDTLVGEAVSDDAKAPFSAAWDDDVLVVTLGDRSLRFARTAKLVPALADLGPPSPNPDRTWTLAVYLGGDNNLEAAALDDLRELRAAMPKENVEVIFLIDRAKGFATDKENDWTGAGIFRIRPDGQPPELLRDLGEIDTGDASTLASFLAGTFQRFPAQHHATFIWNHGGGWKGIVLDEDVPGQPGQKDMLNLIDIRVALRTAVLHTIRRPLDLIAFDACLMSQLEVALQVHDLGHYMTASEAIVPGNGYPYDRVLPLFADANLAPRDIATGIVRAFGDYYEETRREGTTIAALDLAEIPAVASALSTFGMLGDVFTASYWPAVQRALFYAESYGPRSERLAPTAHPSLDIRDLVHRIAEGMKPMPLDKWVNELDSALDRAVIATRNGDERHLSRGLAISAPRTAAQASPDYAISPLSRVSDWPSLLAGAKTEAAKHADEPLVFSDLALVASVVKGKSVVHPFDADGITFTLTGKSIVQVLQLDLQRDGPGWVVLRKRWVPDPLWMSRTKDGASALTDLFMPRFVDGKNELKVELTCQRFLVTDGATATNLTLDATAPDHGAPLTTRAHYYAGAAKEPVLVEIAIDPVFWVAIAVNRVGGDTNITERTFSPAPGDRVAFLLETYDDAGTQDTIETTPLPWGARGPYLQFSQDDPGRYRSAFIAQTMDGRQFTEEIDYDVEKSPAMDEWTESWKDVDLDKLKGTWNRFVMLPDGTRADTHTATHIGDTLNGVPGLFQVESETLLAGKTETVPQLWLVTPGPVPCLRIINPIAGAPDLCWYGPVRLGKEENTPWIAMKALQVGGVIWRFDKDLFESLKIRRKKI